MKHLRRSITIGLAGVVLGSTMSIFAAGPATAGYAYRCDTRINNMEQQAAAKYQAGKLSDEAYGKVQSEIAKQQTRWGC